MVAIHRRARVSGYRSLGDASAKLPAFAGAHSALLCSTVPDRKEYFSRQRARTVVQRCNRSRLGHRNVKIMPVGRENGKYNDALFDLKTCIDNIPRQTSPEDSDKQKKACEGCERVRSQGTVSKLLAARTRELTMR